MVIKEQTFQRYSEECKRMAVEMDELVGKGYASIAKELGALYPTQIKNWVKKSRNGIAELGIKGSHSPKEIASIMPTY